MSAMGRAYVMHMSVCNVHMSACKCAYMSTDNMSVGSEGIHNMSENIYWAGNVLNIHVA